MTTLTRHDKHLMALGIRWQLSMVEGIPPDLQLEASVARLLAGAIFAPGELETLRDELLTDPDFAEAYAAAATADGWREFLARQEGPGP